MLSFLEGDFAHSALKRLNSSGCVENKWFFQTLCKVKHVIIRFKPHASHWAKILFCFVVMECMVSRTPVDELWRFVTSAWRTWSQHAGGKSLLTSFKTKAERLEWESRFKDAYTNGSPIRCESVTPENDLLQQKVYMVVWTAGFCLPSAPFFNVCFSLYVVDSKTFLDFCRPAFHITYKGMELWQSKKGVRLFIYFLLLVKLWDFVGKAGALTLTGIAGISGSLLICLLTFKTRLSLLNQRSKGVLTSGSQTLGPLCCVTFNFKQVFIIYRLMLTSCLLQKSLFTLDLLVLPDLWGPQLASVEVTFNVFF